MTRLAGLAGFELRYQAVRLTFLATLLCLAFIPFALVATGFGPRADAVNGAFIVTESLALLSLMSVFALPLLCVHAALRDDEHGMRGLIDVQPVSRGLLLAVRFVVVLSLLLAVLLFCTVLLAAFPAVLSVRADRLVAFDVAPYARAFVWLVLPNALWCTALLFAVAAATRSTLATFVGAVCIYAGYLVTALMVDSPLMAGTRPSTPELLARVALLDPFGLSAFFEQTRYLPPTERSGYVLQMSGHMLQNRLMVLGLGALCAAPLLWLDERIARGTGRRSILRAWWTRSSRGASSADHLVQAARAVPTAVPHTQGLLSWWHTARGVAALESRVLLRSWPLLLLLVVWVVVIAIEADGQLRSGEYGTRVLATTSQLADAVPQALELLGALCVLYFAVEVFGRERVLHFAGIRDATPAAGTALLAGKLLALFMVPLLLTVTGYGTTVALHVVVGGLPIEWDVLIAHMLVSLLPLAITTAMAAALQVLIGQRWLAMLAGLVLLIFSAQGAALGAEHPLWRFGAAPAIKWSDLSGYGPGLTSWLAFQATWLLGGMLWLMLAAGLWPRGEALPLVARLRRAPVVLQQGLGLNGRRALAVVALLFAGTVVGMAWVTTVQQPYTSSRQALARRVDYERRYAHLMGVAQPSVSHVDLIVDLEPRAARATITGAARLTNTTAQAIDTLYVTFPTSVARVTWDNLPPQFTLIAADSAQHVYTLALTQPLQPDSSVMLPLNVQLDGGGIRANGNPIDIAANGTYLHSTEFLPRFGFMRGRVLRDSVERVAQGLPVLSDTLLLQPASHIDSLSAVVAKHGQSPAWYSATVTIRTDDDQVAQGPGLLVAPRAAGNPTSTTPPGRRTFTYQRQGLGTPAFVITSGRYAVLRDTVQTAHGAVPVEVWHNPRHAAPAARLLAVSTKSLAQLVQDFGAYPHDALRVIEVSSQWRFGAYAMPGSIYLTETRGMLSDAREGAVDLLLRRIGHEVAHEWWGHAVNPLDVEGRLLLVETLARYAEQLLVQRAQGEATVHDMLGYEEDRYFRSRWLGERSLLTMIDDDGLFYGKGALAMHAMRHLLGDSLVLQVARQVVQTQSGPRGTATAAAFVDALMAVAPDSAARATVREWFAERVIYDFAVDTAALVPSGSGTRVTAQFSVTRTALVDSAGQSVERTQPLDGMTVPVGLRGRDGGWHMLHARAVRGVVALDTVVTWPVERVEIDAERVYLERDRSNNGRTR